MTSTSAAMAKEFNLPMIPGSSCGEEMMRRNYRKTQIFGGKGERVTKTQGTLSDYTSTNTELAKTGGSEASGVEGATQSSAVLGGKVLRFFGYTLESIQESNQEKDRVRKVVLNYFLEDGTISISEPKIDNSGFAFQGTMIKRHVVPLPEGGNITFDQLSVGTPITVYGRQYIFVDADAFTRQFYSTVGVKLADAQDYPRDAYTEIRARPQKVHDVPSIAATTTLNITLSADQIRSTQQFLAFDRNVLRCDCIWDDTKNLYGEIHYLTLYYFLSDDCIAVVEKDGVNTGRDPFPNFVRRQKIPRPGTTGKFENVSSSLTFKAKDKDSQSFYTDADIRIGQVLNIFGRDVLICDYDKNTRDVLREKYNVTDYAPIDTTIAPKPKVVREHPPYNGFGDEEDSLGSCLRLDVKPPRKDGSRFAKFSNNGVKFVLRLDNGIPTDEIRRFVLTCFLADDTIAIFEPVQRNSGIVGGKFLQRQKVKKPDGKPFVASDFFVGCRTTINGFNFVCIATDERSLSFMEQNSSEFAHSNVNYILQKVQAMLISATTGLASAFFEADRSAKGSLELNELNGIFQRLGLRVSDQELLTVLRYFDRNGESSISYEEFISRVIPEGLAVGQDGRGWEEIFEEMTSAEYSKLSVADKVQKQKDRLRATTAAYAARSFLEQFTNRTALFTSEFRFIADYASDSLIGEKEFRMCCTDRLKVNLTDVQLDALAEALFPVGARRIPYEELMRLFHGTSNLSHNLSQIKRRR